MTFNLIGGNMAKKNNCPFCNNELIPFLEEDYNWSDYHCGLSEKRQKRFEFVAVLIASFLDHLAKSKKYKKYNLKFAIPEGLFSTGVKGDNRTYSFIVLIFGPKLGEGMTYEVLDKLSTEICNRVPVNRVAYCIGGVSPLDQ